jgi:hypothetical protein
MTCIDPMKRSVSSEALVPNSSMGDDELENRCLAMDPTSENPRYNHVIIYLTELIAYPGPFYIQPLYILTRS